MQKAVKIYQLVCYVNAYNKRLKKWETLYTYSQIYAGKEGLKTAYAHFEIELSKYRQYTTQGNWKKYGETRGKVELQVPHIHENGQIAYWADKVLISHNPDNI